MNKQAFINGYKSASELSPESMIGIGLASSLLGGTAGYLTANPKHKLSGTLYGGIQGLGSSGSALLLRSIGKNLYNRKNSIIDTAAGAGLGYWLIEELYGPKLRKEIFGTPNE